MTTHLTIAKEMKSLLTAMIGVMSTTGYVMAGHPIVMAEKRACADADLVILARIEAPQDLKIQGDPFSSTGEWRSAFTKIASVKISRVLHGSEPSEVRLYGGKMPGGTDYRIMEGEFLLLLKKMDDGAYRAVDWHYSFAPIRDERVGWLMDEDPNPERREWLTPAAVLHRIKALKAESQTGSGQPADRPESKSEGGGKPQPEAEGHSR